MLFSMSRPRSSALLALGLVLVGAACATNATPQSTISSAKKTIPASSAEVEKTSADAIAATSSAATTSTASTTATTATTSTTSTTSDVVISEGEPVYVADPADDASVIAADAYGELTDGECYALLTKRGIPFAKVPSARGVETPIRFTGLLHGVDIHGGEPPAERETSPTEIVDCRLALALDDFAEILSDHHIVEAAHWSIYRAPPAGAEGPMTDHPAGLAMDLGSLIEADGSRTGVLEDWRGEVGAKTCGNGAYPVPATKRAWRLRAILCATGAAHIFHLVLTPNFNAAHHDHFHLEIKRHSKYSLVK